MDSLTSCYLCVESSLVMFCEVDCTLTLIKNASCKVFADNIAELSIQAGVAFGFSGTQAGTVAMASGVSSAGAGNANMGTLALPGSSSGPGTNSLMAGSLGPAGGPGTMASNRVAVSATSVQEQQYLHAMMQNLGFPYHPGVHYPGPHFVPPTFSGPPTHMGTQQVSILLFLFSPGLFFLRKALSQDA
jgi:hypothetical protein